MSKNFSEENLESLVADLEKLIKNLPYLKYEKWISRSLANIVQMANIELERLDWKILAKSIYDLQRGFELFYPYRYIRKVAIFGSARISKNSPEYLLAVDLAQSLTRKGFMIITGAGGGIMEAGNKGAGSELSFGLNINLPFEQHSNAFITGDDKLLEFKYFFIRKLFFLRESDALVIFPGGFGTLDETFECLTLTQTGKFGPAPLIFLDRPGGDYWYDWHNFIGKHLLDRGLISPDDQQLYVITDRIDVACDIITNFYRVYHSSRYVGKKLVLRLKCELLDSDVELLNNQFIDLLVQGEIRKSKALPEEAGDPSKELPRLVFEFNQRNFGRLHQLIGKINELGAHLPASGHPEQK